MYFKDRLEEQHVLKRRSPSPVKQVTRLPPPLQTGFSQDVWPRHIRKGTVSKSSKFEKIKQSVDEFGQRVIRGISPGNLEKPKKRKSAAVNTPASSATATSTTAADNVTGNVDTQYVWQNPFAGIKLPSAWIKKFALAGVLLAAGIVGLNWEAIPRIAATQPDILPASLEDPFSPLSQRVPEFSPVQPLFLDNLPYPIEYSDLVYMDIPLNVTEVFAWTPHVVAPGETISGIAVRHMISQESIIALNGISETWNLQAGRTLRIPNMNGIPYTVQANDTSESVAQRTGIPLNVLLDANDIYDNNLVAGRVLFIPGGRMDANELRRAIWRTPERMIRPLNGRITSGFGWREDPFGSGIMQLHRAVDIAGRIGDPVRAAMRGTVIHRGANPTYGNFIVLKHGDYQTLYAHLSAFSVAAGEEVRQGQEIGRVGISGRTTGPHLHFAVFYRGEPINPVDRWR
ncbi:MAG: M23 family metallopeptidase [Treponema sp.]|nr:M23 family metallopeptidase [Treponema sp.]